MKKSIKWRITIIFIMVVSFCIGAIILCNTLIIEPAYIDNRVNILKKTYEVLDDGIMNAYSRGYVLKDIFNESSNSKRNNPFSPFNPSNPMSPYNQYRQQSKTMQSDNNDSTSNSYRNVDDYFSEFLNAMQDRYSISIMLADNDNNYFSLYKNTRNMDNRIRAYLFKKEENKKRLNTIVENEKYTISINRNANGLGELESFGFLSDNETVFLMTTPIVSMKESIDIFNNVLIMISLIAIFIGSIIIYFTSSRITEPIKELANLSKKMSNLDFDSKYKGNRIDEIGILGNSMNEMNKKLENTIKDLKNANIKLQSDIEQKEKLDTMRKEFVANVSHELKTPIALIQGYTEGLEQGMAKTDEDKAYYLNVIKDEASKMNKMVRELLELSLLEKEVDDLDVRRVNLKELVCQVVGAHELDIEQKKLNIDINIDDNIVVWADEFKLEEVVRNYFTNAMNHIDDNKIINMYVEKISENKIRFFVYNSGEQLSDENLIKIWDKFYKTDKARTRAYGGTGLGLSIVKIIADKHKTECGAINVDEDSTKGIKKGIKFYYDLYMD